MNTPGFLGNVGIRSRIAGGSLLIAILISIAAGIILSGQIDRIVRDGTKTVLASDSAPYVVALKTEPGESFDAPGPAQLVAVVKPDGTTPVDTLPAELSAQLTELTTATTPQEVIAGDTSYLVLTTQVAVSGQTWSVVAARNAAEEVTTLGQMRALLFAGLAVISLGTAVTAWALTTVSLGPVQRLRRSAEAITDAPSSELLEVGPANDEISQLARTLNDLIERLRASAARERQLVSDASHELRTPISLLNTQLQVAVAEASSIEQLTADIQGARRNVARLAGLVTSLLELSTIEAVDSHGTSTVEDLDREAVEAVDRGRFRARETQVAFTYTPLAPAGPHAGVTMIRPEDFGRILDNVIGNALRALGGSGELHVSLQRLPEEVVLTATDTGGGMDPAFEAHAFERFTRQDAARAGGSGAGLGLAIVAAIVKNAHGTVALSNDPGVGLTVRIALPFQARSDAPSN